MKTPASPKVTTGGICAGYATLLLALLNTVTPDSLTFLGHLAPVSYGVVIGGSYALGAWLKEDPLRTAGAAAQAGRAVTSTAVWNPAASFAPAPAPAKTFPAAAVAATTAATAADVTEPAPAAAVYTPPADPEPTADPAPEPEPVPDPAPPTV